MGKGDRRTRRGKLFLGSFGNSRPHKPKKKRVAAVTAGNAAPVAQEQKTKASSRKSKKAE